MFGIFRRADEKAKVSDPTGADPPKVTASSTDPLTGLPQMMVPDPDYMSQGSGGGTSGLPPPVDSQTEVSSIADAVVVDAPSALGDPGTEHGAADPMRTEAMEESHGEGLEDLVEPPDAPPEKTDANDEDDAMGDQTSSIEPVRRGVEVINISDDDRVKMETDDADQGPVAEVDASQGPAVPLPSVSPVPTTGADTPRY